jgi:hypothetical protein
MSWLQKLAKTLLGEAGSHPLEHDAGTPTSAPIRAAAGAQIPPVQRKVLTIVHDPIVRQRSDRRLRHLLGWNDPDALAAAYRDDLRAASGGYADFQIVERLEVDDYPLKQDGYRYDEDAFLKAWGTRKFHEPDAVDYLALVREFDLIGRVDRAEIDEVWLMGFPYCGYYESIMAGPGAFWCNAPPLAGTEHASRRFIMMGFNYERGVGEMLEDFGHRAESILAHVFRHAYGEANLFERFMRYDRQHPGRAEVGNIHFAPNSERDYDWGNRRYVLSRCDTWYAFPDLSGEARKVNCDEWGGGDIRLHHLWWLEHLPRAPGSTSGVANHWWQYVVDPNLV